MADQRIEVFADVGCPFTHVGLRRLVAERERRGHPGPLLHLRPWPLELVNGEPLTGPHVAAEVEAIRRSVAPDLFAGLAPDRFPTTTMPILAAEAAAHQVDPRVGEAFSLRARELLFEHGIDPSEPSVLEALLSEHGIDPLRVDAGAVPRALEEGRTRGVVGSPYFFVAGTGWFCPTLDITHDDAGFHVTLDEDRLSIFLDAVFSD